MAELLKSLATQTQLPLELIVIEDGSTQRCDHLFADYAERLNIRYHYKPNTGRSDSRNVGMRMATGDYFIFFDSDCIIPPQYIQTVSNQLKHHYTDAYGGPDAAHPDFSALQKAISYSMTSFLTTGGIRGGKKQMEKFCPRSFNMGISRKAYEATQGYRDMLGEDIDLSLRIGQVGMHTQLIREAFVYHKRRVDLAKFWKQVHTFGQGRISLSLLHPSSLKLVHLAPAVFTVGVVGVLILSFFYPLLLSLLGLYAFLLLIDATYQTKNLSIGLLAVVTSFVQLLGYGTGFIKAFFLKVICRQSLETRY